MSEDFAARIAQAAQARGVTVVAAESLTGGMIATEPAAAEAASTWSRGALVAYSTEVKRKLLGVSADIVVSAEAAEEMATAILSPESYLLLTGERGWTADAWATWVGDVLIDSAPRPGAGRPPHSHRAPSVITKVGT